MAEWQGRVVRCCRSIMCGNSAALQDDPRPYCACLRLVGGCSWKYWIAVNRRTQNEAADIVLTLAV